MPESAVEDGSWYAVQTRARHEKKVAERLLERGITNYLPLTTEEHNWSDHKKIVQLPLFNCYLFAKLHPNNEARMRVLTVDGVLGLVGEKATGTPIPEEQIEAVRMVVEQKMPGEAHPF